MNNTEDRFIRPNRPNQIDYTAFGKMLLKHNKLFLKVLSITFVLSVLLAFSIPNYYTCTVLLAPELSGASQKSGSLASLASSFGINLGSNTSQVDALMPTLYPDLMNSVAFRASLFPVQVQCLSDDASTRTPMSYYDYLENEQRLPWWTAAMKTIVNGIASFFKDEQPTTGIDPFQLTKEQYSIVEDMNEKVVCDVDLKTMVITINVTDQDAYIAATMADSVQRRLQDFITEYRTQKARVDVEHYKKLFAEAKQDYEKALSLHASYSDANQNVFLQRVRSQATKLQSEVTLQYQAYSQVAAQLKLAEAKVQEDMPAFTILQPATVPVRKAGPKRAMICGVFLLLAFIGTTAYLFYKNQNELKVRDK